jgi:predicted transcriptional regulator
VFKGVFMPDYKLSLSPELDKRLREIAEVNRVDINQLILNAISTYAYLKESTKDNDNSVGILDSEEKPLRKVDIS